MAQQQGTGVSHAMSPGAATWLQTETGLYFPGSQTIGGLAPTANPSTNARAQQERRNQDMQAARQQFNQYRAWVEKGVMPEGATAPPTMPLGSGAAHYAGHMSDPSLFKFARKEVKGGHIDTSSPQYSDNKLIAYLDRFFELRHPAGGMQQGDEYTDIYGSDYRGRGGGGGGRPPVGGSVPSPSGGGDPNLPSWYRSLQNAGISADDRPTFTIPRLGEFTWQDRMAMASEYLGARAMSNYDTNPNAGSPGLTGRLANYAQYARENAAFFSLANRDYHSMRNFSAQVEGGGASQGFSRQGSGLFGGNVDVLGAGFRMPLSGTVGAGTEWLYNNTLGHLLGDAHFASPAAREALRQEITSRRVALAPGVSGEEASRIMRQTQSLGYSGNMNEALQMDVFRRLQQQGIGPEQAAPLVDQAVRQGNNSLRDIRDTILDLGNAARGANMTLQEAVSATQEYSNSMASMGGRVLQSQQNAAVFARSGVDPRTVSGAFQTPFVQGMGTMLTGLPGMFQGTLGAPAQAQILSRSLDQALAMSRPFAGHNTYITTASGERIQVGSGQDVARAFASRMTGVSQEFIERYQRNPNILTQAPEANQLLQTFGQEVGALDDRHHDGPDRNAPQASNPRVRNAMRNAADRSRTHPSDQVRNKLDILAGASRPGGRVEWGEVEAKLRQLDPSKSWQDRVAGLRDTHDLHDRLQKARDMVSKLVRPGTNAPDHLVGLTPEARKWFRIEPNRNSAKNAANAGGPNVNSTAIGPGMPSQGMDPLTQGQPGG
jgi:type II secretory pathway pseudopilin PulG